jgi:hypothetical protein
VDRRLFSLNRIFLYAALLGWLYGNLLAEIVLQLEKAAYLPSVAAIEFQA